MKHILKMDYRILAVILFLLPVLLSAAPVSRGNLEGVVLDGANDRPLLNAIVKIKDTEYYDITDKNGLFNFTGIPYGRYVIEVSYIGYRTAAAAVDIKEDYLRGIIVHLYPIPIETSAVIITGTHNDNKFDDLNEMIGVLKGKELEREMGMTLASTLKNETGISIRSMGPAPARPVIRGLGSDRIQIAVDNITAADLSATSPDHAVALEPFSIERIEVERGPKILLHNSTSVGGLVNVIKEEILTSLPEGIEGIAGISGSSVNSGYFGSLMLKVPYDKLALRVEASGKRTDDVKVPGSVIKNSGMESLNLSSGLSFIDDWGSAGVSASEFSLDYGVPGGFVGAHPNGVDIEMLKRQFSFLFNYTIDSELFEKAELRGARDYYRHTEFERPGLIGAQYTIFNYRGNLDLHNKSILIFDNGISGLSAEYRDFKIGGFVFTPPAKSLRTSFYSYQRYALGRFNYETAVRFSIDKLDPESAGAGRNESFIKSREFYSYSLSFSMLYGLTENIFTGFNVSRSSRVPAIEELYSEGPHLAAYSYEVGNPDLEQERGWGLEGFVYYKSAHLYAMVTGFYNRFSYFITPRNTGRINTRTLLPVYQTTGIGALFTGFESHIEYKFLDNFSLTNSVSYTRGSIEGGAALPQIPPMKVISQFKYHRGMFTAGIENESALAQRRVDVFEEPTAGYSVFNFFAQYSFITGSLVHNLSFITENIFNKEYRNHLSRIKVILPEEGINFKGVYRVYF